MRVTAERRTFTLSGENIDAFSKYLKAFFESLRFDSQNSLRIRLNMEEMLLRFRDHFGEEQEVESVVASRFGKPYVQVELRGSAFNPLSRSDEDLGDWSSTLLTAVGMSPEYSYSGGKNILRLMVAVPRMNPVLKIATAIVVGLVLGLLLRSLLGEAGIPMLNAAFDAIYGVWEHILTVMSGPAIFFMVISTILNTGAITERGGNSRNMVVRFFLISFLIAFVTVGITTLFLRIPYQRMEINGESVIESLQSIAHLIPSSILTPFEEVNTPLLLLLAFVLGTAMNILGEQVYNLTRVVKQMNLVGMLLIEGISELAPLFVGIFLTLRIAAGQVLILTDLWLPILLSLGISALCMGVTLLHTGRTAGMSRRVLFKKLWEPFATATLAGSLNASFGLAEKSCTAELGMEKEYAKASLRYGLVLYMPISVIGTLVFTIYIASKYQIEATALWYLTAVVLSVVLFVSTPPVPGANLLAYIVIFAQLGIPAEARFNAMIFDIIFGIVASAANLTMLQMDMIHQARRIGLIDLKRLRKSV